MTRVLSGIQPTGDVHLGNYLGAIRRWVEFQDLYESCFYCVVDLHALTLPQDPAELRASTLQTATVLLAAGLDPDACTLFVQGHVPQHTELTWLLECTATFGEVSRMTQFKEKSEGQESVRVGLFTYPVLQAADILLYDTDQVPVGDDQRQHLELCRDLAIRFNHHYGTVFTVPEAAIPTVAARVMDLQDPRAKMSKSLSSPQGKIDLLEDPASIIRKIKRAVTDTGNEVTYDPDGKPGVSNLLELLAVATGSTPRELAGRYTQYGPLKSDTAEAIVEYLRPVQERYRALEGDPGYVHDVLAKGATKAEAVASVTLARAREAIGLLPR
ncbi:MAG TPA: tryptophan--tRNA ligase [Acidimicrobiales bacterium]|nr:tryptophan--tRNA ligase [Acidimicrobiales bacterium]